VWHYNHAVLLLVQRVLLLLLSSWMLHKLVR